jgi:hypothetical protein
MKKTKRKNNQVPSNASDARTEPTSSGRRAANPGSARSDGTKNQPVVQKTSGRPQLSLALLNE